MAKPPKRHHYLPQFYLSGFTRVGTDRGDLWVLDLDTGKQWKSPVRDVAVQSSFYTIKRRDEGDSSALEKGLSQIEGLLAPVLRKVIATGCLPKGIDFEILLNLVAGNFLRTPAFREIVAYAYAHACEEQMRKAVATPDNWDAFIENLRKKGTKLPIVPYEGMKAFIVGKQYNLTVNNLPNHHLMGMSEGSRILLPILADRRWHLTAAAANSPDYICSDNPVAGTPSAPSPFIQTSTYPATLITLPLSRRLALTSGPDGLMLPNPAPPETVALINSATSRSAKRYLFSPDDDFVWMPKDKSITGKSDLLRLKGVGNVK